MTEHRAATRGFYDKLQLPKNQAARDLLEEQLNDPEKSYDEIINACKSSGLFEDLKLPTASDLTRYRQRKARDESRATVLRLIEDDSETLLNAAVKNPTGTVAKAIRKLLTEGAVARFEAEMEGVDVINLSREAARHALVEQRDRKLNIEEDKAALERRRIELAERQAELQKDRFGIGAGTWKVILEWLSQNEPTLADELLRRSDDILGAIETWLSTEAA